MNRKKKQDADDFSLPAVNRFWPVDVYGRLV